MSKLTQLIVLETLISIILGVVLFQANADMFQAFLTCVIFGLIHYIAYNIGKEIV